MLQPVFLITQCGSQEEEVNEHGNQSKTIVALAARNSSVAIRGFAASA